MGFTLVGAGLTHANGHVALADVMLKAEHGEHIAVIGPSGAGKTSLISLIGTALPPSAGSVAVLGADLPLANTRAIRTLRSRIGTIYQAPPMPARQRVVTAVLAGRLGSWPAWKSLVSLLYPLDIAGARAALVCVDLAEKLFDRCDQVSGGQLQRIGIARVLYQRPDLVLADEPVSALDPVLALKTVELLVDDARRRGATLLASLHAVDLALSCFPRIVGLRQGRVVFDLPRVAVTESLLQDLYAGEDSPLPTSANGSRTTGSTAAGIPGRSAACL